MMIYKWYVILFLLHSLLCIVTRYCSMSTPPSGKGFSHQNQLCIIINILLDFKLKWVINTQYLISSFLFYLFIYCFVFKDVNATVLSSWWHLLYCERLATRWRKKQPYSYWRFSNEICIDFFSFCFSMLPSEASFYILCNI